MAEVPVDTRTEFITEAIWHGGLERAEAILEAHPSLRSADIHIAAILGDDEAVCRFIVADPASVHAKSPPYGGDALNYLGLSKYLRLHPGRTEAFARAATALLDAGADPNTGFWKDGEFETVGYGVAGVAHNERLTRLLIERGADPNDGEVVYHSPESHDLGAMRVVVETGRVTPEHLVLMLVRKIDWHHYEGIAYLLQQGADPNFARSRGWQPLHHAVARDNALRNIELLLDHGADPSAEWHGLTAIARAARHGRNDLLELLARRGVELRLTGVDRLIEACAMGDTERARAIGKTEPALMDALLAMGGDLLARFAGTWNTPGVKTLLDLGLDPATPFAEGDGYWDQPAGSLPIHIAAWRCAAGVLKLLIERGSPVDVKDPKGRTPVELAVKACTSSYWTEYCSPASIEALLDAGAGWGRVKAPSGNAQVDALLHKRAV